MKINYVPHIFGPEVDRRLSSKFGWLTAGVATSIPWPSSDVCLEYAGEEYFLRGSQLNGSPSPPCITVACIGDHDVDVALGKIYRFTSILSWFEGGYVEVSGFIRGSRPSLYGSRTVYSSMGIAGEKSFNCNYLPVIESENIRKALAFWREGQRLYEVHVSYAFLSFYKVIESQFKDRAGRARAKWISANLNQLTDRAAARVSELRGLGLDVSDHLYESGRCAVAHASLDGEIIDPDVSSDRKRLSADLVIMQGLAEIYICNELQVPTSRSLYRSRNRLSPWESLFSDENIQKLKNGLMPADISSLNQIKVSIGLWPDGPIQGLEESTLHVDSVKNGIIKIHLINTRKTIQLVFSLDFKSGLAHTNLDEGGLLLDYNNPDENDVRAYATFFYNVFGNSIAQMTHGTFSPVECEVFIPKNMRMVLPINEAIETAVEEFLAKNQVNGPKKI